MCCSYLGRRLASNARTQVDAAMRRGFSIGDILARLRDIRGERHSAHKCCRAWWEKSQNLVVCLQRPMGVVTADVIVLSSLMLEDLAGARVERGQLMTLCRPLATEQE